MARKYRFLLLYSPLPKSFTFYISPAASSSPKCRSLWRTRVHASRGVKQRRRCTLGMGPLATRVDAQTTICKPHNSNSTIIGSRLTKHEVQATKSIPSKDPLETGEGRSKDPTGCPEWIYHSGR